MKPNILFIIVDSLRADICYGNNRNSKTPNIDSLIKDGIYFKQSIGCEDATLTALGSIFTGKYPYKTGIRDKHVVKPNPEITNYVRVLKDFGYHAYATIPKIASDFSWFSHDFENKDKTYPIDPKFYRLYDGLAYQIIDKLDSGVMKEPWFYFIHILDLHCKPWDLHPYSLPKEFDNALYGSTDYQKLFSVADFWLGKIFQKINKNNTIIVITADHGDYDPEESIPKIFREKGEMNFKSHVHSIKPVGKFIPKFLLPLGMKVLDSTYRNRVQKSRIKKFKRLNLTPYQERSVNSRPGSVLPDELVHIPLIFSGYGVPSNTLVSQQVGQVDIFPTIAELVGLRSKSDDIDGRSLVPYFSGKNLEELPVYMETAPFVINELGVTIGIRTSQYKYYRDRKNPKEHVHLFDLKNDPREENNIVDKSPEIVERMESILSELIKGTTFDHEKQKEFDEKEETKKIEEELRKLGYLKML